MANLQVLGVVVLFFVVVVHSFTRVCDVADTSVLYEQTFKVYEARIQCESASFNGPHCSSYYINMQKLMRSDLSFKKCEALQAAPYYKYAGTPTAPEGVFFKKQDNLSQFNNKTGAQLRQEISEDFDYLLARLTFLWESTRTNMSNLITTQWSNTRTLDATEEQDNRHTTSSEHRQTREFDSSSESSNRDTTDTQNDATRDFDAESESTMQDLVETDHADLNSFWTQEINSIVSITTDETVGASNELKANVYAEESANRDLAYSETASSLSAHSSQTQQTNQLLQNSTNTILSTYNTKQAGVNNAWGSLVSSAASMLNTFLATQDSKEDRLTTLLMHITLQSNAWASSWGCIGINEFGPADIFNRQPLFNKLRAITNETVIYNKNAYGYDFYAAQAWNLGEAARADGNLRRAADYYSQAYIRSTLPY